VYSQVFDAYPAQRNGSDKTLRDLEKFCQADHDSTHSPGTGTADSRTRTQSLRNLQSPLLSLLPEGKHGEHPAPAQTWPAKGDLFIRPHPTLIPDFDRAGKAMPAIFSGRPS